MAKQTIANTPEADSASVYIGADASNKWVKVRGAKLATKAQLDEVEQVADDAKTMATTAKGTAETADSKATAAQTAAGNAESKATAAKNSADAAAVNSNAAITSANEAKQTATAAQTAAGNAESKATAAKNSADAAAVNSNAAITSANEAKQTATAAQLNVNNLYNMFNGLIVSVSDSAVVDVRKLNGSASPVARTVWFTQFGGNKTVTLTNLFHYTTANYKMALTLTVIAVCDTLTINEVEGGTEELILALEADGDVQSGILCELSIVYNASGINFAVRSLVGARVSERGAVMIYPQPSGGSVSVDDIQGVLPLAKGGTGKSNGEDAANVLLNSLSTGGDTPSDEDFYISQWAGGSQNTYHRRPLKALWLWIKSKLALVATSGSYNDLTNKPTIPTVDAALSATSPNPVQNKLVTTALNGKSAIYGAPFSMESTPSWSVDGQTLWASMSSSTKTINARPLIAKAYSYNSGQFTASANLFFNAPGTSVTFSVLVDGGVTRTVALAGLTKGAFYLLRMVLINASGILYTLQDAALVGD